MEKGLEVSADVISLMWRVIDQLPENLHDFDRDSFGMANLFLACGVDVEPLEDPNGSIRTAHSV